MSHRHLSDYYITPFYSHQSNWILYRKSYLYKISRSSIDSNIIRHYIDTFKNQTDFTLAAVSNIKVERSRTCRAAPICALLLSSLRSAWRSPVSWASSTISDPNWLNAFTNSVKFVTLSSLVNVFTTWNSKCEQIYLDTEHSNSKHITTHYW